MKLQHFLRNCKIFTLLLGDLSEKKLEDLNFWKVLTWARLSAAIYVIGVYPITFLAVNTHDLMSTLCTEIINSKRKREITNAVKLANTAYSRWGMIISGI